MNDKDKSHMYIAVVFYVVTISKALLHDVHHTH